MWIKISMLNFTFPDSSSSFLDKSISLPFFNIVFRLCCVFFFLYFLYLFVLLCIFGAQYHVAQCGLKCSEFLRMPLNSWSLFLYFPNAEITHVLLFQDSNVITNMPFPKHLFQSVEFFWKASVFKKK